MARLSALATHEVHLWFADLDSAGFCEEDATLLHTPPFGRHWHRTCL
jgi:hypothetical protein